MTIFRHELRRGRLAFIIWTVAIGFMMFICMIMFPEMEKSMTDVSTMFSDMGSFTTAFGMDRVDFGEVMGFYAIECGNILGIGGAFFAALLGTAALAKEEKDRTAEFLFTHPVSRASVIAQKLAAVIFQLLVMNVLLAAISAASFVIIGEDLAVKEFALLHAAFTVMQLETACVCFGISAFINRSGQGIGIGLAAVFYFFNIVANISDEAEFVKYITPFSYAEASNIIADVTIDTKLLIIGVVYGVIGVCIAFIKYTRKDIAS